MRFLSSMLLAFSLSCSSNPVPASLSGPGVVAYRANQVGVSLGTVQHAAIELNKIQQCTPAPCHPLLSDANTKVVIDAVTDAVTTLKATPDGWQSTANTALTRIETRLDADGKQQIAAYLETVRTVMTTVAKGS
jgi:hypothetical protein